MKKINYLEVKMDYASLKRLILIRFSLILFLFVLGAGITSADGLKLIKEQTFSVKDWENVYVNSSGSNVKIESWDKSEAYIKIFGNRNAEEKMKFTIEQKDKVIEVIAKKRNSLFNWFGSNISTRIEIFVPRNFNAHVETSGGDISVTNLVGGFKLFTSGGDITLNKTYGKLKAETSGGNIKLTDHTGEMNISTSGGEIICRESKGDLSASTSGGDVKIDMSDGKINTSTSGGDITIVYSGENKGIDASTSGGSIRAKLPAGLKAKVHLETSGGGITNNFPNSKSEHVSHGRLDAEYNGGGPMLKLETSGGDVIVDVK
jgi:Putative adhesin